MFRWLSYGNDPDDPTGNKEYNRLREWSFTLKDDVYVRYKCFNNKEEFKDALVKKLPFKIDIGAVYNAPPSLRQSVSAFRPEEKELVFDIDMTDYDPVRNCCGGANICRRCWPLMNCAIKITDSALREVSKSLSVCVFFCVTDGRFWKRKFPYRAVLLLCVCRISVSNTYFGYTPVVVVSIVGLTTNEPVS